MDLYAPEETLDRLFNRDVDLVHVRSMNPLDKRVATAKAYKETDSDGAEWLYFKFICWNDQDKESPFDDLRG